MIFFFVSYLNDYNNTKLTLRVDMFLCEDVRVILFEQMTIVTVTTTITVLVAC